MNMKQEKKQRRRKGGKRIKRKIIIVIMKLPTDVIENLDQHFIFICHKKLMMRKGEGGTEIKSPSR